MSMIDQALRRFAGVSRVRALGEAAGGIMRQVPQWPPVPHVRLPRPRLRTTPGHERDKRDASYVELFFDLMFAAVIGQLAGALQEKPTAGGVLGFIALFVPVWWLWVTFSIYSDRHGSDDAGHRGAFLLAMLFVIGLAASAHRAFHGDITGFVIAFALLRMLQLSLYARAMYYLPVTRPTYRFYLVAFGAGGGLWVSALFVGGPLKLLLCGAGLLCDSGGVLWAMHRKRWLPLNGFHLAGRFHLLVLIVLGESVSRLIAAAGGRPWSVSLGVVLAATLATLAALWWISLNAIDIDAIVASPSRLGWYVAANLPITLGIGAASAGLFIAVLAADGAGTIGTWARVALYAGVGLHVLSNALLPSTRIKRGVRLVRLAAAVNAVALVFMGAIVAPVFLVPALACVLLCDVAAEVRLGHARKPQTRALGLTQPAAA